MQKSFIKFKFLTKSFFLITVLALLGCAGSSGGSDNPPAPDNTSAGSINGSNWVQATSNISLAIRRDHTSVVFANKIWVLGGTDGNNSSSFYSDVLFSSNGSNWEQATGDANWSARRGHTSVVFGNKIWVLGGGPNDVWSSSNGSSWEQATGNAGWSTRQHHTSVVFDSKIWVLGGYDDSRRNDVWSSSNGTDWTEVTASADWLARSGHTSVVFDSKIWVLGGFTESGGFKNDVWSSSNGTDWTEVTASSDWIARSDHTSVVFDSKIWVLGGRAEYRCKNDVWSSSSGSNWEQATDDAGWFSRSGHASVVFNSKLWVIDGSDCSGSTTRNTDVWYTGSNNNSFGSATSLNFGLNSATKPVTSHSAINNNSFANSTSLNKSLSSHSAILTAGTSDYYRINLTAGNWTFSTDGINTDCELYNSSDLQTPLVQDNNGGDCFITSTITTATAGDYYIVVKGMTDTITGNYTLKITAP